MNRQQLPLAKHPAYKKLIELIKEADASKLDLPLVELSGLPFVLHDLLLEFLQEDLDKGFLVATRDSQEIRKYCESILELKLNEYTPAELVKLLIQNEFEHSSKVQSKGEYAVKGDLIYCWPLGYEHPVRLSYFGDELEEAVMYDEVYGRSYEQVKGILLGDIAVLDTLTAREHLKVTLPNLSTHNCVLVFGGDSLDTFDSQSAVNFDFAYSQLFFQRFDLLEQEITKRLKDDYKVKLFTHHTDALPKSLHKYIDKQEFELDAGFISNELKLFYLTDRELFGTVFLSKQVRRISSSQARKLLTALEGDIEIGDFVVHEDYGIALYKGLKQESYDQKIYLGFGEYTIKTITEDYLLLEFAKQDELYVPLSQIDKLTKYINPSEEDPKLSSMGRVEWDRIRLKVKESIAKLAQELVEHYAKRALAKAHKFHSELDKDLTKFIEDFPYQETPDQLATQKDIFKDLLSERPMNRLIVGDVGFGKTEVAMRAAYKVASEGFQVAVLCPTTVLTAQHEKVFFDRFKNTGLEISSLSRLAETNAKNVIEGLEQGKIDIVIGTHKLLSSSIKFKKLGLIIIDEEQKFGVKQKEKLKQLAYGVHVLAMSATPIPRSLSMALSSIQDISIIQTPPEGRKSTNTIVAKMDWQKVVEAISFEVKRNGQVYYLHNRVQTILSTKKKLETLMPELRFCVAHGQMHAKELAQVMEKFYNKEYDVLICTTIIENGIDMPNVNTIIIESGQNFGLGQLHQLRGRVGRSDTQAYAYVYYDGEDIHKDDSQREELIENQANVELLRRRRKYKDRLKALLEAQEVGSGFNLASRDLEIRGAGNLLGKEQHGNISFMGYGLYMQMLAQEIEKLKAESD